MLLYPNVQKTAQDEIDRLVGQDRLPGFEDRESLPYVTAAIMEALRWAPPTPIGTLYMFVLFS